jgi:hypothetical protein
MGAAEDHADKIREAAGKSLDSLKYGDIKDFPRLQYEWKNEWRSLSCEERLEVGKIPVEKSKDSLPHVFFVRQGGKITHMAINAAKEGDSMRLPFEGCE